MVDKYLLFACFVIISLMTITLYYAFIQKNAPERSITCIMITGKNNAREKLARHSLQNFREQTYANKHLVIINHGDYEILDGDEPMFNVTEIKVAKNGKTLGELRNMGLEFVPYKGLFCTWDDDDYRSPMFLSLLYADMVRKNANAVVFCNRVEYNLITGFAWKTYLANGFVHFIAEKDFRIRYDESKDTMEDLHLPHLLYEIYNVVRYDNKDPSLYIRLIHESNTSKYVDMNKNYMYNTTREDWKESTLSEEEKNLVDGIVKQRFASRI